MSFDWLWDLIPVGGIAEKLGSIDAILGIATFLVAVLLFFFRFFRGGSSLSKHDIEEIAKAVLSARTSLISDGLIPADKERATLESAVRALEEGSRRESESAIRDLREGKTEIAAARFRQMAEQSEAISEQQRKQAAETYQQSDPNQAVEAFAKAVMLDPSDSYSLNSLGVAQFTAGRTDDALATFAKLRDLAAASGDKRLLQQALGNMGLVHQKRNELAKAAPLYKDALKLSEELKDDSLIARNSCHLGVVSVEQGDLDAAAACFKRDYELSKRLQDANGAARASGNLAKFHGDLGTALVRAHHDEFRGDALDLAKTHLAAAHDYAVETIALGNKDFLPGYFAIADSLGRTASMQMDDTFALKIFAEAVEMARRFGLKREEAGARLALAAAHFMANDKKAYATELGAARSLAVQLQDPALDANIANIVADLLAFDKPEPAAAAQSTLHIFDEKGETRPASEVLDPAALASMYLSIGQSMVAAGNGSGRISKGREKLQQAKELYRSLGDDAKVQEVDALLAKHGAS
jgi:tetratricopeptide (TPR) repeat protein